MTTSPTVSNLIKNVLKLSEAEFEEFFTKVKALYKTPKAGNLSLREFTILQKIEEGLPKETQMRFDYLIGRRDSSTITHQEYQELLSLIDVVEKHDLERLKLIAQLAELRKLGISETVEMFNIKPKMHGSCLEFF